jgi:5'-phosphate synthase pdxT subunit
VTLGRVAHVGVLALQGDYEAHGQTLRALGASVREVRRGADLADLAGLVIPGGESTTLLNLMADEPWFDALGAFHARGGAIFGTCAGAILLARRVVPDQPSLALLDAVIERNAYGRQADSFQAAVESDPAVGPLGGLFIRAPRFREVGAGVSVLARLRGEPVAVREGQVLAATFHPELAKSTTLHRIFLDLAAKTAVMEWQSLEIHR